MSLCRHCRSDSTTTLPVRVYFLHDRLPWTPKVIPIGLRFDSLSLVIKVSSTNAIAWTSTSAMMTMFHDLATRNHVIMIWAIRAMTSMKAIMFIWAMSAIRAMKAITGIRVMREIVTIRQINTTKTIKTRSFMLTKKGAEAMAMASVMHSFEGVIHNFHQVNGLEESRTMTSIN